MNQLMVEVQKKSAILKSDKVELSRQFKEIEFMTEFLRLQAVETSPIDFLQLYAGHNQVKSQIYKQRTTVSDIQVDLKLQGKLSIHVDQTVKSVDIQHMTVDKQSVLNKVQTSIAQQFSAQRSTGFRTQLLNKGIPALKDNQVFNTASQFQEAQGKIPSYPRALENEREQQMGVNAAE